MKIRFLSLYYTQQWAFHILPTLEFYFESHSPLYYNKPGVSGIYISVQWGKWKYTVGFYKKLSNWNPDRIRKKERLKIYNEYTKGKIPYEEYSRQRKDLEERYRNEDSLKNS